MVLVSAHVAQHIRRAVSSSLQNADDLLLFTRIRQKRQQGKYRKVVYLERYLLAEGQNEDDELLKGQEKDNISFSSCCASLCCTPFETSEDADDAPKDDSPVLHCDIFDGEVWSIPLSPDPSYVGPSAEERRKSAAEWEYKPDDTPLPDKLLGIIKDHYEQEKKRLTKPTIAKFTRFINHLHGHGGEGHLSIKALKKMGFGNDRARAHLEMLEDARLVWRGGYCPAAGIGRKFALTKRAMKLLPSKKAEEKSA